MNPRKKKALIVISCIALIILYLLLAVKPADSPLKLTPDWSLSILDAPKSSEIGGIPFKTGQLAGYLQPDGTVSSVVSFPFMATIASDRWAVYSQDAKDTPIYSVDGTKLGVIEEAGFPWFTENGSYLFLPGGTGFVKLDDQGKVLWKYEDISPITAFSASEAGCIAGYAEGKLVTFNPDGSIQDSLYPAGSNYQVILGADISDTGGLTACVSGIDRQRFMLFRTQNGQVKNIYHEYLEGNLREQTLVQFTQDGSKVFFSEYNGLGILDCSTLTTNHIKIEGKIFTICEQPENNLFFILTKNDNYYSVYIFENPSSKIGNFNFKAQNASIITDSSSLYVISDSIISKFEVTR